MKYAVLKIVNSSFSIVGEYSDKQKAIVGFHNQCMNLWNATDVLDAVVVFVDNNLMVVDNYREHIFHDAS